MFQVVIYSKMFSEGIVFFRSESVEDCVQVALNVHRAMNTEHRVQVFDTESSQTRLSLYSVNFSE